MPENNTVVYESAIQADNGNVVARLGTALLGAIITGIIGGILLASIIIWQEGWFSVRNLSIMGILLGFFIAFGTSLGAGQKSPLIGIIAILGCAVAVIVGKYTMVYWFSREAISSVFDPNLIEFFVSTPDIWGIEDAVWFIATAVTAWFATSRSSAAKKAPVRSSEDILS